MSGVERQMYSAMPCTNRHRARRITVQFSDIATSWPRNVEWIGQSERRILKMNMYMQACTLICVDSALLILTPRNHNRVTHALAHIEF